MQTLQKAKALHLTIAPIDTLPTLQDIDTLQVITHCVTVPVHSMICAALVFVDLQWIHASATAVRNMQVAYEAAPDCNE